jgi:hypothetical protein
MTEPRPVTDLSPADWIVAGVGRDEGVGSLLPAGFEAYARVLHPAAVGDGGGLRAVTWAEVAQANKRRLHRLVQFDALIGVDRDEQGDYAVATGEIPGAFKDHSSNCSRGIPTIGTIAGLASGTAGVGWEATRRRPRSS